MSNKGAGSYRAYVMANNKATRQSFETEGDGSEDSQYRREQEAIAAHRISQAKFMRDGHD